MRRERWLAIVGIGEDGLEGLTPAARRLVAQAAFIVGGKRHLALAGSLKAETMVWPSQIENALDTIEAHRGRSVCVLASGDPFFFGVGAMLMRRFPADEMISVPAPSAFALAADNEGRLRYEPSRGRSEAVDPILADPNDGEPAFPAHGAAH